MKKCLLWILIFGLLVSTATAWWDSDWTEQYQVNVDETIGIDRVNEPVFIHIGNLTIPSGNACYHSDYRDLRVVLADDTTEIPSQIIKDHDEDYVVFLANRTANATGHYAYIYCGNENATAPTYNTGFNYTIEAGDDGNFTYSPFPDTEIFVYHSLPARANMSGLGLDVMDFPVSNVEAPCQLAWNCELGWGSGSANTVCTVQAGAIMIRLNCTGTDHARQWVDYYHKNLRFRVWDAYEDDGGGWRFKLGQNRFADESKYFKFKQDPYNYVFNVTTNHTGTDYHPIWGFACSYTDSTDDLCYGLSWNNSKNPNGGQWTEGNNDTHIYGFMRYSDANDPQWIMNDNDWTPASIGSLHRQDVVGWWMGWFNTTDAGTEKEIETDMNPLFRTSYSTCPTNWTCQGWGICTTGDFRWCNNVTDQNNCSVPYTGDYTEQPTKECDYCTPDWSCDDLYDCSGCVRLCGNATDLNDCYGLTALQDDLWNETRDSYGAKEFCCDTRQCGDTFTRANNISFSTFEVCPDIYWTNTGHGTPYQWHYSDYWRLENNQAHGHGSGGGGSRYMTLYTNNFTTAGFFSLEFDWNWNDWSESYTDQNLPLLQIMNGGTTAFKLRWNDNNWNEPRAPVIEFWNTTSQLFNMSVNMSTWYHYQVDVDVANKKWHFWSDGEKIVDGQDFSDFAPTDINKISWEHGAKNDHESFMDNVSLFYTLPCEPSWYCSGWDTCNISDEQPCNEASDLNNCGDSYTGNYSEFMPLSCDYCTPNCVCTNQSTECINNYYYCLEAGDENDCYAQTGLPADNVTCNKAEFKVACGSVPPTSYAIADLPKIGIDIIGEFLWQFLAIIGLLIAILVITYLLKKAKKVGVLK